MVADIVLANGWLASPSGIRVSHVTATLRLDKLYDQGSLYRLSAGISGISYHPKKRRGYVYEVYHFEGPNHLFRMMGESL